MILIYIGIGMVLVLLASILIKPNGKSTSNHKVEVKEAIESLVKEKGIQKIELKNSQYDIYLELEEVIYLIKVITVLKNQEIVITNKVTWILNNKKGSPHVKNKVPGIKEFIEYSSDTEKKVKKVVIVYPDAHNILKYINECEMVIVNPSIDVHGCKVIQYNHLSDFDKL